MKSKNFVGWLLLCLLLVVTATGCNGVLTKRNVTAVPGPPQRVEVVVTNTPPPRVQSQTNAESGAVLYVTNTLPPVVVTNYVTVPSEVLVTNYVPNPRVAEIAGVVQTANSALNPTPTAPLVNLAAAGLTALAGAAAAWQNRRAKREHTARSTAEDLLRTVITGVEAYADPGVKQEVAKVAAMRGNGAALDTVVQSVSAQVPEVRLDANQLLDFARTNRPLSDIPARYHEAVIQLREALARS